MKWLGAVAMALNQLFNALTGGNPDEAFSSRVGRMRADGSGAGVVLCSMLDVLDPRDGDGPKGDHCDRALHQHEARVRRELERIAP